MKPNKQAKWIVGITGTALSAFILSQLNTNATSNNQTPQQVSYQNEAPTVNQEGLSNREKELAKKDWSNFSVESSTQTQTTDQSTAQQPADSSINQPAAQPINPPTDRNTSRS